MKRIIAITTIALSGSVAFADEMARSPDTLISSALSQHATPIALTARDYTERDRKVRDGTYVSINNDSR